MNGHGHGNGDANGNGSVEAQRSSILPAVLSIGYNPFYKNTVRSVVSFSLSCIHFFPPQVELLCYSSKVTLTDSLKEIHVMPPTTQPSPTAETQPTFNRLPDFYGTKLNLLILGYIRPEFDYVSMEALIEDIRIDCEVARQSLLRPAYLRYLVDDGTASKEVDADREWLVKF